MFLYVYKCIYLNLFHQKDFSNSCSDFLENDKKAIKHIIYYLNFIFQRSVCFSRFQRVTIKIFLCDFKYAALKHKFSLAYMQKYKYQHA